MPKDTGKSGFKFPWPAGRSRSRVEAKKAIRTQTPGPTTFSPHQTETPTSSTALLHKQKLLCLLFSHEMTLRFWVLQGSYLYCVGLEFIVSYIYYPDQEVTNLLVFINRTWISCDVFKCIEIYRQNPKCNCLIIKCFIRSRTFSWVSPSSKLQRPYFSSLCTSQATQLAILTCAMAFNNCLQPLGVNIKVLAKH